MISDYFNQIKFFKNFKKRGFREVEFKNSSKWISIEKKVCF